MQTMSGRTQIAIVGHWHYGTSIIADTFRRAGMAVGNAHTGWTKDCEAQCKHSELNWYGDSLWRNGDVSLLPRVSNILKNYIKEAEKNDWQHYGVKFTHFLQVPCLIKLYFIFNQIWTDCIYIVPWRHPYEVYLSTVMDLKWNLNSVMKSYKSVLIGYKILKAEHTKDHVIALQFPECFRNGSIERLINWLGMDWKGTTYKESRIKNQYTDYAHTKVYEQFTEKYGDILNGYLSIQ